MIQTISALIIRTKPGQIETCFTVLPLPIVHPQFVAGTFSLLKTTYQITMPLHLVSYPNLWSIQWKRCPFLCPCSKTHDLKFHHPTHKAPMFVSNKLFHHQLGLRRCAPGDASSGSADPTLSPRRPAGAAGHARRRPGLRRGRSSGAAS